MLGIVLGAKSKSIFPPGWKLCVGEHPTFKGSGTISYDNTKFIPLTLKAVFSMANDWSGNNQTHLYAKVNDLNVSYLYCQPRTSYSVGYVSINNYKGMVINLIDLFDGLENLYKKSFVKTTFSFTCTMWLEKSGGGVNNLLYKKWHRLFKKGGVERVG